MGAAAGKSHTRGTAAILVADQSVSLYSKLDGTGKRLLAITADFDPTFWPELSEQFIAAVQRDGVRCESMHLPCGHYSLGEPPFSYIAGFRFGSFLMDALA